MPELIKPINTTIKNLFQAWFTTCKKKLLSAILRHCTDYAIYTDLPTYYIFWLTLMNKDCQVFVVT